MKTTAVSAVTSISRAHLYGQDPATLTVPALKRWLLCRGASTKGRKSDLIAR